MKKKIHIRMKVICVLLTVCMLATSLYQPGLSRQVLADAPEETVSAVTEYELQYNFSRSETKNSFTNYYGAGGRFTAITPTTFDDVWTTGADGATHKAITAGNEDPTIVYLNNVKVKYFEAEFTMKFNNTNGLPGFVFGAEKLDGWGAFNNLVYIMADAPADPVNGDMYIGFASTPLNVGLGSQQAAITSEAGGRDQKQVMHTYRVRVTRGLLQVFVDGGKSPVFTSTFDDNALTESQVGLHAMGADVTFGTFKLNRLDADGNVDPFEKRTDYQLKYDFSRSETKNSFTNYYGAGGRFTAISPTPFDEVWTTGSDGATHKAIAAGNEDPTIVYLNDIKVKYFEAEFTMKFNNTNGLPGFVFGAEKLDGWGAFNNLVYIMADAPADPVNGDMHIGFASTPLNVGLGAQQTAITSAAGGRDQKQLMHTYRVRVTRGLLQVFVDGGKDAILTHSFDDNALTESPIGLHAMGADVTFGTLKLNQLDADGNVVPIDDGVEREPVLETPEKGLAVQFDSQEDKNKFTNYYAHTWQDKILAETAFDDTWELADGKITRKPLAPLNDATVLYLNDYVPQYFETTFNMKFNTQNGIVGLVFGANTLDGWGAYNSLVYFMADRPDDSTGGLMEAGLCGENLGIGLGSVGKDITPIVGLDKKNAWHQVRVRVTEGRIRVYLDGIETPILDNAVDNSRLVSGKIGLSTVGADIGYGGMTLQVLNADGSIAPLEDALENPPVDEEPELVIPEQGLAVQFDDLKDADKFTNYFADTWMDKILKETPFGDTWELADGKITRKLPVTPLSDATVLYLNDYAPQYFETTFNMKFNTQNGLVGLVFGSNTLDGWGGYSSFLYFMAADPAIPGTGTVTAGLLGENLGIDLGAKEADISAAYGLNRKDAWHQVRIRVTEGRITVYLDDNLTPIMDETFDNSKIVPGQIGLTSVGADISYGGMTLQVLNADGSVASLDSVLIDDSEPVIKKPQSGAVWNFNTEEDAKQFTNYYGNEWQELTVTKKPFKDNWSVQDGTFNRKTPVKALSEPTQIYLNEYLFEYFEAVYNIKFNDQNGLAGLIFGANNLNGWGGYNTFVYMMADNPSDVHNGDAAIGICGERINTAIGTVEKNVNEEIGYAGKQKWHQIRVRVTKGLIEVYLDGGTTPVLSKKVTDSQIREGKIGLSTVGADTSFGGLSVQPLDAAGNPVELKKVLKPNDEPILPEREYATTLTFDNPIELKGFDAYFGETWTDRILKKEDPTNHWEIKDGILSRKLPVNLLSDASTLYLFNKKVKYFDVIFTMKFNQQNGIAGIVYTGHDMKGWAGYNSHVYFMSDQPSNMFSGTMTAGICGLNYDMELGTNEADILSNVGFDRKGCWNTYRVRATYDTIEVYVNDLENPVLTYKGNPETIVKGKFGLSTVGADISFGDLQIVLLDAKGNPVPSNGLSPKTGDNMPVIPVMICTVVSGTAMFVIGRKRRRSVRKSA